MGAASAGVAMRSDASTATFMNVPSNHRSATVAQGKERRAARIHPVGCDQLLDLCGYFRLFRLLLLSASRLLGGRDCALPATSNRIGKRRFAKRWSDRCLQKPNAW